MRLSVRRRRLGHVATKDVVYMLHGLGIRTGVDLDRLVEIGQWICGVLKKESSSKAGRAIAEAEHLVLAEGLAGVHREPLDPGLDVLVHRLRARAGIAVRAEQARNGRQRPDARVVLDELEIELVQLQDEKLPQAE